MAKFRITGPNNEVYEIEAPDSATDEEIMSRLQQHVSLNPATERPSLPPEAAVQDDREQTSTISALAQGAGQGVTFGFSDEIEGALRGGYDALTTDKSFSQAYDDRLETARERLHRAKEDNPVAFYGGEIASAALVPAGLGRLGIGSLSRTMRNRLAANNSLRQRARRFAKEGAAYGAAFGFGTGEGDDRFSGTTSRLSNAVGGAAVGGAVGAVAPAAVDLASSAVRGVTRPLQALRNPRQVASEKFGEAVARDTGASRRGIDYAHASDRFNTRAAAASDNPNMTLMDVAGENTRRLMRQASDMPNDVVQGFNRRLDHRQAHQWLRLERGLAEAIGDPNSYRQSLENVIEARATTAARQFDQAFRRETRLPAEFANYFQRPTMQRIVERVGQRMADEGAELTAENSTRTLHRIKIELDDLIGGARRAQQTGNTPTAGWDLRTLVGLKSELMTHVRRANPEYARALDGFAGHSALANAAEDGLENALRLPTEDLARALAQMNPSEQQMWRLGAARALAGKIRTGDVMRDRTKNLFSSPDIQNRMRLIFPDNASRRRFQRLLVQEARMAKSRGKVQGNSTTSQNLIQSAEAGAPLQAVSAAGNAMMGRLLPAMQFLGRQGNRMTGLTPDVAEELLRIGQRPASMGMPHGAQLGMLNARSLPSQRSRRIAPLLSGLASVTASGH